jgi:hypothetical protein
MEKDIIEIHNDLIKAKTLICKASEKLLKLYQEQAGYIDVGNGCKIPGLGSAPGINPRTPPPCCGDEHDPHDYR